MGQTKLLPAVIFYLIYVAALVFFVLVPGQEKENLDFLSNCGAALRTSSKFTLTVLLKVLIDNPERVELLKNNIRAIKKQNTSEDIADLVCEIIGQ